MDVRPGAECSEVKKSAPGGSSLSPLSVPGKKLLEVLVSWAAVTSHHRLCGLKQQSSLSQPWRAEVQSWGVRRAVLPLEALGGSPSISFPASGSGAALGVLGWKHSSLCLHLHSGFSLCVQIPPFYMAIIVLDLGPIPLPCAASS